MYNANANLLLPFCSLFSMKIVWDERFKSCHESNGAIVKSDMHLNMDKYYFLEYGFITYCDSILLHFIIYIPIFLMTLVEQLNKMWKDEGS